MFLFFADLSMAYYPSFPRIQINESSSSDSATPNYFTDELSKSSPATSFDLPEDFPLRYTLSEINKGIDSDAEQMLENAESQTSNSSAAIERATLVAFQSFASESSQESHIPPRSQPRELHSLPMDLDEPFESTTSSQGRSSFSSPSLLFSGGSSSSEHYQPEQLVNCVDPTVESTVSQERMHQVTNEYDADDDDYDEPIAKDDGIYQCPSCLTKYKTRKAFTRHRDATLATILNHLPSPISSKLLKCLNFSAGPARVFLCSEPRCTKTAGRLDLMKKHVKDNHGCKYTTATREIYTLKMLQDKIGIQARGD